MRYGAENMLGTFQNCMHVIMLPLKVQFEQLYVDNIVPFLSRLEQILEPLSIVSDMVKQFEATMNPKE